jgi:hypothetical protein
MENFDMHDLAPAATRRKTDPIRSHFIGSDTCTWTGITASGAAPVLVLCRQLLAAGLDPDTAMEVYRAGTLALRVRSLSEGARLTVKQPDRGRIHFAPYVPLGSELHP